MNISQDRIDRIQRLYCAWADAEQAMKIAEHELGDAIIPAVKELRYAGRKLAKALNNYIEEVDLVRTDEDLEDAIYDCFRARHDATDAATAAISLRLEHAIKKLGYDAVKEHFPEYANLRGMLADTREKIATARHDQNGRHDLYEDLETEALPTIVTLFVKFKANEPHMKDQRIHSFLMKQGFTVAFFIMLALWIYRLFFSA